MNVKKNIGTADRILRLALGIILLILSYWKGGGWISWTLLIVGLFCVFEAIISWCPIMQLLGRNSCKIK